MKHGIQKSKNLRKKAEEKTNQDVENFTGMTADDIKKLVHELGVHQIELEMQNDEIRRTQEELERSRSEYVDLYDFAPVGYFTLDSKGVVHRANLTASAQLGIARSLLVNKPLSTFISNHGSIDVFFSFLNKIFETKTLQNCEILFKKKNGKNFYARLDSAFDATAGDDIIQCRVSMTDITDRKLAEDKLKILLEEKEMLLKEVHHRVKNNFAIIFSLIDLQGHAVKDASVLNEFSIIKSRMKAMSLIHEKLYQSDNLSSVNLSDYISSLIAEMDRSYTSKNKNVAIGIDVQNDLTVNIDTGIHLGLIINEIITNSLKHAFPAERDTAGIITISASSKQDDSITLTLGDNGIGIPGDVDILNSKSLGMKLIHVLTEKQLNGDLQLIKDNGTKYIITFKNNLPEAG
ncbi:MAG: hypothetical protein A2176_07365 [Spirochaetes bacterium RBG_13_51_14]|nr:MAG: hypothetical protein A2176_07365 [Spirochaetes bacterium RBG_13_51_14]